MYDCEIGRIEFKFLYIYIYYIYKFFVWKISTSISQPILLQLTAFKDYVDKESIQFSKARSGS